MIDATHEQIPYRGRCIQLCDCNSDQVVAVLAATGADCNMDRHVHKNYLMVRWSQRGGVDNVRGMEIGEWVVTGENGYVKIYSDERFNIKYRKLPCRN